jgi:hypothetical protein
MVAFLSTLAFLKFYVVESDAPWWTENRGTDLIDEEPVWELVKKVSELREDLIKNKGEVK